MNPIFWSGSKFQSRVEMGWDGPQSKIFCLPLVGHGLIWSHFNETEKIAPFSVDLSLSPKIYWKKTNASTIYICIIIWCMHMHIHFYVCATTIPMNYCRCWIEYKELYYIAHALVYRIEVQDQISVQVEKIQKNIKGRP